MIGKLQRRIRFFLLVMIFAGAVIMGVMFPAGRSPLMAHSCAMAAEGQYIYLMMSKNQRGTESDDCVDYRACSSVSEFIERLVDVDANGVKGMSLKDENRANNDWNIAIGLPDDCDASFPVMISANFNPRYLDRLYEDNVVIPLCKGHGGEVSRLEDKVVVVVRMSGVTQMIGAKFCTKRKILGELTSEMPMVTYLTPDGRTVIDLRGDSMSVKQTTEKCKSE